MHEWRAVPEFSAGDDGRIALYWRDFSTEEGKGHDSWIGAFVANPLEQLGRDFPEVADWRVTTTIVNHQFWLMWRKGRILALLLPDQKAVALSIVKFDPAMG